MLDGVNLIRCAERPARISERRTEFDQSLANLVFAGLVPFRKFQFTGRRLLDLQFVLERMDLIDISRGRVNQRADAFMYLKRPAKA